MTTRSLRRCRLACLYRPAAERATRATLLCLLLAIAGTAPAPRVALAQLISIKTVPIADGEQFSLFPSRNQGMGGVALALHDTLLDPFRNPASGARVGTGQFFGSPALYSVSSGAGGGRTLPLGLLARSSRWFGAALVAAQQLDEIRELQPSLIGLLRAHEPGLDLSDPARHNMYAFVMLGRRLYDQRTAFAASVQLAGLNAVDGVDLLYAGSEHITQSGGMVDLRVGALREWEDGRSFEAVMVHNRFRMMHDVTYLDWFWDPVELRVVPRGRLEHNPDRTNIWGVHLQHMRPLSDAGWRVGGVLTANRMSHPKIPNYDIMNIPRDPGYSNAFNIGIGVSRVHGPAAFGIEAIYEPIWSETWSDSEVPVETIGGSVIQPGGRIIENDFRFSNALLRMGVSREMFSQGDTKVSLQLGLAVRSINYHLDQYDNVQERGRWLRESWVESMPTWGISMRTAELEIRYAGRRTHGTGRPGIEQGGGVFTAEAGPPRNILVAPSGPLRLDEVRVVTHQVSISLPLR